MKCKNKYEWPKIETKQNDIKFAVQINGKTRDIITISENLDEKCYKARLE